MFLNLKVITCDGEAPGTPLSERFDESGGVIGRSAKMSLRLPDPERIVSSKHADITFRDGQFFITDSSTNGTFVHGSETPLQTGSAVPVAQGDQFQIGRYVIAAEVGQDAVDPVPAAPTQPLGAVGGVSAGGLGSVLEDENKHSVDDFIKSSPQNAPIPHSGIPLSGASQQPGADSLIPGDNPIIPNDFGREGVGPGESSPGIGAPQSDASPFLASAFQTPKPVADKSLEPPPPVAPPIPPAPPATQDPPKADSQMIPSNWDGGDEDAAVPARAEIPPGGLGPPAPVQAQEPQIPPLAEPDSTQVGTAAEPPAAIPVAADTGSIPQMPTPTPRPASQVSGEPDLMARILAAAGFNAADLSTIAPEVMAESLGLILREAVSGITEAMRDRTNFKAEFRLDLTRIQAEENNPLKFSTGLDEVVKQLLAGGRSGLIPPGEAFREAFDDLRVHQLAMMVGVKVCLNTLIARMDPDTIEEQLSKRKATVLSSRKALCWELYNEIFEEISKDADDGFQRLLAEDFATAYEEQVNSMKRARFKNKP